MKIELWQAIAGIAATFTSGGAVAWLRVKAMNKKDDATSAEALAHAYSMMIDDMRKQVKDLQDEVIALRTEQRQMRTAKDDEIRSLRAELIIERRENSSLRGRVARLEADARAREDTNKAT
jgi:TolA-binding protein